MMLEIVTAALAFPEISPAAFSIPNPFGDGSFPIRWYALGYIAGILLGLVVCAETDRAPGAVWR